MNQPRTNDETRFAALVGRNVRARRRALGLTAEALSRVLGEQGFPLSAATISKIELCRGTTGRRVAVTVDQLMAIATALQCDPMNLLTEPSCSTCNGAPPMGFSCNACSRTN